MKSRIFKIALILLFFLLLSGILFWMYLPKIIVHSVTSDSGIQVIPVEIKASINEAVDRLPMALEEADMGITIEDVIEVLEKNESPEIISVIDELESQELKDKEQVLQIIEKHLNLYKLDNVKTMQVIRENLKISDVKKVMKMIRENGKPYMLTIPVAKETIKGILLEKQKKIEAKLN